MSRGNIWTGIVIAGWMLFLNGFFIEVGIAWGAAVPDTGQSQCYGESGVLSSCPQAGSSYFGQDAGYSINVPSYTKLGINDTPLPDTATLADGWLATKDNVTGLVWEIKTDDGGLHDKDNTYTWCNTSQAVNGVTLGVCANGTDTKSFLQAVNAAKFAGHEDWRLPTPQEIQSLVHYEKYSPAINSLFFSNILPSLYWSSLPVANGGDGAWGVDLLDGYVYSETPSNQFAVMCVRGSSESAFNGPWVTESNGTVTDAANGLSWQQQEDVQPKDWIQALSYCENLVLAGEGDWRLPTIKELETLVDYGKYNSASRITPSSAVQSLKYWSSTADAHSAGLAWYVDFSQGGVASTAFLPQQVRCVRGGVMSTVPPTPPAPSQEQVTLSVKSGWSLLSSTIAFQVDAVFSDAQQISSVWKWENGSWAVYLPGETNQGSYAQGKGFAVLSAINPGEGFWVNSVSSTSVLIPGTPVYGQLTFTQGWNLVGLKSDKAMSVTDLVAGQGITSLWAWQGGTWAVFLPGEADSGKSYAQAKGFGFLSTIGVGEGLWVNKP